MDAAARAGLARRLRLEPSLAVLVAAFVATLFLSALLLFSVQPMFARMVLPRLGGSPSVWAVSMCFFQATLLAGYAYAHLLNRLAAPRFAPALHLLLLGAAVLALPVGVPAEWSEPPPGNAYLWLMCLLAVGVGLPFFGVSANAPLLQSWFSQSGHPQAADPYFLYGASNLGSLVALLAYPVLIEPFAGLSTQAAMWAVGFIGLGLLIAGCGLLTVARDASASVLAHAERTQRVEIGWRQRAHWIALSFVPSGLLVAFTTYVTTDIASAPFLWVLPLALFLGTFILVFRDKPVIPHSAMLLVQPILVAAVLFGISTAGNRGWMIASVAGTLAFFVTTMVCHKELYDRRPPSQHLTEFYFWMSLGGVLGGMFAALAAPQLFNAIWEYPLLLVLGMALRPGALQRTQAAEGLELAAIAIAMLAVMIGIGAAASSELISSSQAELSRIFIIVGCGSLAFLNTGKPLRQLVFITIAALAILVLPSAMSRGTAERSFFGTHRVTMTTDGKTRLLMHGTTIHGAERIMDQAGKPAAAPVPATYYYPASPMARGVGVARDIAARNGHSARIGIVGLGAGSMACHARSQEAWRFYEIDPVVAKIARDPSRFRFLAHCRPDADIVIGDARLTLAKEKDASFDYLVIDAFSSDSVPVHLMTVEAVRLYLRKLTPDGLLALHVSNRHLDLVSVAGAVARALPGTHAVLADDRAPERGFDAASSYVVFMSRSAEALQPVRAWQDVQPIEAGETAAWTDDYSNILSALWRKYRHKH
jgi:spermidine synthase